MVHSGRMYCVVQLGLNNNYETDNNVKNYWRSSRHHPSNSIECVRFRATNGLDFYADSWRDSPRLVKQRSHPWFLVGTADHILTAFVICQRKL
jgi:hypothetical protein